MGLLSTVRQETANMWFMLHILQYLTIYGHTQKWDANYTMIFFGLCNDHIN